MNENVEKGKQVAAGFFRRHRLYTFGIIGGFGLGLFSMEAFQSEKNPLIYIGSLSLIVLGSTLYRYRDGLK